MEDVGIFYCHLVYFTSTYLVYVAAIWYTLRLFGIFYSYLVYVTVIWYILR
jgi:hypothetical protein